MNQILKFTTRSFIILYFNFSVVSAQSPIDRNVWHPPTNRLEKATVDDYWHYHYVGNLGLTVTNFGIIGEGYNNPAQPSCMYKLHTEQATEQVEHFSYAGLWVGGKVNGVPRVSTAIMDGVFPGADEEQQGIEFTTSDDPGDTITVRSSYSSNRDSPLARYFSPDAVSHQDFVCDFTDVNTVVPGTSIPIAEHVPLGINVHLESYAWGFDYTDAFVILNYTITNVGNETIDSLHVGMWVDASVGNMNFTNIYEPGGGWNWYDNLNGYLDSLRMCYQYDADGDQGFAESYSGFRILGTSLPGEKYDVYYNQWAWKGRIYNEAPEFTMPNDEAERFTKMSSMLDLPLPTQTASWMMLISAGSLGTLNPGDEMNVVFAVVCGRWATNEANDSEKRLRYLIENSTWAQKAYDGEDVDGDGVLELVDEDVNGNGILDPGEDLDGDGHLDVNEDKNGNGVLDRYILPAPPPSPNLKVIPADRYVTLYWDNAPEDSTNLEAFDPISNEIDFEGYRIYSARKTVTGNEEFTLLAQFDKRDTLDLSNEAFTDYDTGFEQIRFDTLIDGKHYYYRFINRNLLNGWPNRNWFAVTAFDHGDATTGLRSFESSKNDNKTFAILGTRSTEGYDQRTGVYPNPYRASAAWDGDGERERMIWFQYLPPRAIIRIYTLAGDLVDEIEHNEAAYTGKDIRLLEENITGREPVFSGGEHAWDLISKDDQAIATGLYLYSVKNLDTGEVKVGKFLVIK